VAWIGMWILPTGYNFCFRQGARGTTTFPTPRQSFAARAYTGRNVSFPTALPGLKQKIVAGRQYPHQFTPPAPVLGVFFGVFFFFLPGPCADAENNRAT